MSLINFNVFKTQLLGLSHKVASTATSPPVLQKLHWLPIQQRIIFKVLCFTYKCMSKEALTYLCDLLTPHIPARSLRSESQLLLSVPRIKTASFGERSFSFAAATYWNCLPYDIRQAPTLQSFRTHLKTFLFKQAFLM